MLIGVAETVMISIASEAGCAIAWFKTRDIKSAMHDARNTGDCIVFLHTHTRVM
jgi:hypothetical protein